MADQLSPDDDDAVAALYRDGSDDEAPPAWTSLREVIGAARASGFDEEPPAGLDAVLLAAARAHAPRPRQTWWQRLRERLAPVLLHPAMAGAAALVVVVGTAGVLYTRDGAKVVQPPGPSNAASPAPTGGAPPAADPAVEERRRADDDAPAAVNEQAPAAPGAPQAALEETPGPRAPAPTPPEPVVRKPRGVERAPERAPAAGTRTDGLSIGGATPGAGPLAGGAGRSATDDGAPTEGGQGESAEDSAAPPPPPPSPSPQASSAPAPDRQQVAPVEPVATRFAKAQAAARAKRCGEVVALAASVRTDDIAYYRRVFVADPVIAACLPASAL
ncbi:MAG: hypothetical protein R3B06_03645 [Kofleriaceae bacterium]